MRRLVSWSQRSVSKISNTHDTMHEHVLYHTHRPILLYSNISNYNAEKLDIISVAQHFPASTKEIRLFCVSFTEQSN